MYITGILNYRERNNQMHIQHLMYHINSLGYNTLDNEFVRSGNLHKI